MDKPVGYKSPPKHTRWKQGQSGNPKGRAKGLRNLKTDLAAELNEIVELNEGGVLKRLTKQQAVCKAIVNAVIRGDSSKAGLLIDLIRQGELDEAAPPDPPLTPEEQAVFDAIVSHPRIGKGSP